MYRLVLLVLAAVAACTPDTGIVRPPPAVTDTSASVHHLDQGWTDAERSTFSSTRQGSYLMPLPWFLALQRTDADTPFAADQLQRFGYLAPDDALATARRFRPGRHAFGPLCRHDMRGLPYRPTAHSGGCLAHRGRTRPR